MKMALVDLAVFTVPQPRSGDMASRIVPLLDIIT
jgi:hypothetical protein